MPSAATHSICLHKVTFDNPGPTGLELRNTTGPFELGKAGAEPHSAIGWVPAEAALGIGASTPLSIELTPRNGLTVPEDGWKFARYAWGSESVINALLTCEVNVAKR